MKIYLKYVFILSLILFLAACGGTDEKENPDGVTPTEVSDTLFYSLDRLSLVDLNINLNALIDTAPESANNVSNQRFLSATKLQTESPGTVVLDTEMDLITYSDIVDSSNVGVEFRNLNDNISSHALNSKAQLDWALENIRIMNTWVILGMEKYQLTYSDVTDVVILSVANTSYVSFADESYSLRQIEVYYNALGQLVVTVSDAFKSSGYATFGRLTFIQDFLYEWSSDIWTKGFLEVLPMSGGSGWFKASKDLETGLWMYMRSTDRNISFNVQMESGWIQTFIRLTGENDVEIEEADFDYIKVANQRLDNDVLTFNFSKSELTTLNFFPVAFTGWDDITAKISETELKNLRDWTDVNPNVALYDVMDKATIIFNNDYVMTPTDNLKTSILASTVDDINGNMFVAYIVMSSVTIQANYLNMLQPLNETFETFGLNYKYGSLDVLFNDTLETIINLPRIFDHFELNGVKGFTDLTKYQTVIDAEMSHIHTLGNRYDALFISSPSIDFSDIEIINLDSISFLDVDASVSGQAVYNPVDHTFNTSSLIITISPSPLLISEENYTMVYGLLSDQAFTYLGQEESVQYNGVSFSGNGGLIQALHVEELMEGTYVLVGFIARVTLDGYIRVSEVGVVSVQAFSETSLETTRAGFTHTTIYRYNDGLIVSKTTTDTQAPTITVNIGLVEDVTTFIGTAVTNRVTVTVSTENTMTLAQALESLLFNDNSGELITLSIQNITFNGESVLAFDDDLKVGTYVIRIADGSLNVTELTITIANS